MDHTISGSIEWTMSISATPPMRFPKPSRTMLHTADFRPLVITPFVRIPILRISSKSRRPNESSPTEETSTVSEGRLWNFETETRWAASAIFRPTPPRWRATVPGDVECRPPELSVSGIVLACATTSTAAEPTTTSLAAGVSLGGSVIRTPP